MRPTDEQHNALTILQGGPETARFDGGKLNP